MRFPCPCSRFDSLRHGTPSPISSLSNGRLYVGGGITDTSRKNASGNSRPPASGGRGRSLAYLVPSAPSFSPVHRVVTTRPRPFHLASAVLLGVAAVLTAFCIVSTAPPRQLPVTSSGPEITWTGCGRRRTVSLSLHLLDRAFLHLPTRHPLITDDVSILFLHFAFALHVLPPSRQTGFLTLITQDDRYYRVFHHHVTGSRR
jgi:hypothetical protein